MTKTAMILQTGKQLVAIAAGRAFKGEAQKERADDILSNPAAQSQDDLPSRAKEPAVKESVQDPGNPNDVDHGEQGPSQEQS